MKPLLYRDAFFATIFVIALYLLLKLVILNIHFLEPGHEEKKDFEMTDLVYSKFSSENKNGVSVTDRDTNIVMVNIGNLTRKEIAELLDSINSHNPKVIALDVLFSANKQDDDTSLATVLKKISNKLVMVGMLAYDEQENASGIESSQSQFNVGAKIGYTNFVTNSMLSVVRYFAPFTKVGNEEVPAFPVAIAEKYNPALIEKLKRRGNEKEIINYQYTQKNIYAYDHKDITDQNSGALSNLMGKIVLVGYLGSDLDHVVTEDYHYTPMNEGKNKKTDPDMSGLAIHANIISMILHGKYISHVPKCLMWTISIILCFLHMIFFIQYFVKKHLWFHLYFKTIQFVSSAIIIGIAVGLYGKWDLRMETEILLAPILLSVDALYFFEPLMLWLNKKRGIKTYLIMLHDH